jgi:hypothetical protein
MSDFSLLREKFVIRETTDKSSLFVANGNRMKIDVPGVKHPIVIRAHSMHMTLRLASKITEIYEWTKTVEKITETFDWEKMWMDQIEGFEEKYTPHTWVAVYHAGQMIYSYNDHHIFFDILENCEHKNSQSSKKYDQSILMTQKAFEQMGRTVMIEQESHMGFVLDVTDSIMMASDFIETVNLSVQGGFMRKRIEKGKIRNGSDDMKRFKAFQTRCSSLQFSINQMESKYNIKYRPEKPDFKGIEDKCAE